MSNSKVLYFSNFQLEQPYIFMLFSANLKNKYFSNYNLIANLEFFLQNQLLYQLLQYPLQIIKVELDDE